MSQIKLSVFGADTDPQTEAKLLELLRKAPAWRKVKQVVDLNETVRTLVLSGLRTRHPNDTPEQLRRRLADLLLGPELALKVYGPAPEPEAGAPSDAN